MNEKFSNRGSENSQTQESYSQTEGKGVLMHLKHEGGLIKK